MRSAHLFCIRLVLKTRYQSASAFFPWTGESSLDSEEGPATACDHLGRVEPFFLEQKGRPIKEGMLLGVEELAPHRR